MEDISKIYESGPIHPDRPAITSHGKKKHKKKKHHQKVKKSFDRLTKIVAETHRELEENDSPFRLCIYQEGDDIFIDIVTIDSLGKTSRILKHDISHAELENIVQHIKSGRGLLFDADV
jgi:hypothetical protein